METKGIVLEMYRMRESEHMESDFYIITDPFSEEINKVTKAEAIKFIKENELHVAHRDNTGRIFDTAAHRFQRKYACSERFRRVSSETQAEAKKRAEARMEYKDKLWAVLDKVWGDSEDEEE